MAWANEVWAAMDDLGLSQNDAKVLVAARYAIKAEGQPRADKMVKQARNKGVANG